MAIINQSWFKRVAESGGKQDDPSPKFEGISAGMFIRAFLFATSQLIISTFTFVALLCYMLWIVAVGLFVMFIPYAGLSQHVYSAAMRGVLNSWPMGFTVMLAFVLLHPLIIALAFRSGVRSAEGDILRARIKAARTSADSSWQ